MIFFSFLAFKFSTVLTSKNVMKQIKGRCRKRPRRWTRWEIYYLPSLLLRTRQRCGSTGGEGFTDMLSQAVQKVHPYPYSLCPTRSERAHTVWREDVGRILS